MLSRTVAKLALALEILVAYVRVRRLLRADDLPATVAALRSQRPEEGTTASRSYDEALRLAHAVTRVLAVVPDARCLARSLVLASLLCRRDVPTSLVIGVRSQPFAAHAWIELGGRPLLPPAGPPFQRLLEV